MSHAPTESTCNGALKLNEFPPIHVRSNVDLGGRKRDSATKKHVQSTGISCAEVSTKHLLYNLL